MKNICLLGATGSIGLQTVDIIESHKEKFRLYAIAFGQNMEKALPIIRNHEPKIIVVQDNSVRKKLLAQNLSYKYEVLIGQEGMIAISEDPKTDVVVNAVMGSVGLPATISAIKQKKQIAIANKETLVTAGHIVMDLAKKNGVTLLPVDSEHSAIFQSLNGERSEDIHKIILTASGGSFRDKKRNELAGVTVEDALNHPNWSMGAKITIDSASMMNKGLEVIEAHWLFDIAYKDIEVLLHKESVIHSMVEFRDKSVMAQLGTPDMRIPIQYALTYPKREVFSQSRRLDLAEISTLHFEKMDMERFPCISFAFEAGKMGGSMPAVLNAANEAAVDLFLNGKITFLEIEKVIESSMEKHEVMNEPNLETIINIDQETRQRIYHRY